MKNINYDNASSLIGTSVTVKIDRQMGTKHPKWGFIYPLNYGYIDGIKAPDGDDLDAYLLGVFEPVQEFKGTCIAMINRLDDDDNKMIVAPVGIQYSDDAILALTEFQERFFKPEIKR